MTQGTSSAQPASSSTQPQLWLIVLNEVQPMAIPLSGLGKLRAQLLRVLLGASQQSCIPVSRHAAAHRGLVWRSWCWGTALSILFSGFQPLLGAHSSELAHVLP